MEMTTLDQWEAEAKKDRKIAKMNHTIYDKDDKAQRILALIDLVRKKDEALNIAVASLDRVPEEIYKALALTDKVGGAASDATEELK